MEKMLSQSKKCKGDRVVAIAGNNRGLNRHCAIANGDKVVVQGLNVRKKHVKTKSRSPKGRIVEIERPIHISNLKVCVEGDTAARLKVRTNEQGERQFVYKQGDQEVIYRSVKKPK